MNFKPFCLLLSLGGEGYGHGLLQKCSLQGFSFHLRGSVTQLMVSWHHVYTAFQFPIHEKLCAVMLSEWECCSLSVMKEYKKVIRYEIAAAGPSKVIK